MAGFREKLHDMGQGLGPAPSWSQLGSELGSGAINSLPTHLGAGGLLGAATGAGMGYLGNSPASGALIGGTAGVGGTAGAFGGSAIGQILGKLGGGAMKLSPAQTSALISLGDRYGAIGGGAVGALGGAHMGSRMIEREKYSSLMRKVAGDIIFKQAIAGPPSVGSYAGPNIGEEAIEERMPLHNINKVIMPEEGSFKHPSSSGHILFPAHDPMNIDWSARDAYNAKFRASRAAYDAGKAKAAPSPIPSVSKTPLPGLPPMSSKWELPGRPPSGGAETSPPVAGITEASPKSPPHIHPGRTYASDTPVGKGSETMIGGGKDSDTMIGGGGGAKTMITPSAPSTGIPKSKPYRPTIKGLRTDASPSLGEKLKGAVGTGTDWGKLVQLSPSNQRTLGMAGGLAGAYGFYKLKQHENELNTAQGHKNVEFNTQQDFLKQQMEKERMLQDSMRNKLMYPALYGA